MLPRPSSVVAPMVKLSFEALAVGNVIGRQLELVRVGRSASRDHVAQLHFAGAAVVVVVLVEAVLGVEFNALEVLLHDEVDDAADRVRSVHGGRAAGQDFDPLDHAAGIWFRSAAELVTPP